MTTFPSHPHIDSFRCEYARARANDFSYAEALSLANYSVPLRFSRDACYAILTAPEIAREPGRMGDALRLISVAFDEIAAADSQVAS